MDKAAFKKERKEMSKAKVRDLILVVGDESYFDEQGNSLHPHLTVQKEFKQVVVDLKFERSLEETIAKIHIVPYGQPKRMKLDGEELSYPSNEQITDKELGCDTASYIVNDIEINTMSDGYYGTYLESSSGETIILLSSGYMGHDQDDFERSLRYVFEENA